MILVDEPPYKTKDDYYDIGDMVRVVYDEKQFRPRPFGPKKLVYGLYDFQVNTFSKNGPYEIFKEKEKEKEQGHTFCGYILKISNIHLSDLHIENECPGNKLDLLFSERFDSKKQKPYVITNCVFPAWMLERCGTTIYDIEEFI